MIVGDVFNKLRSDLSGILTVAAQKFLPFEHTGSANSTFIVVKRGLEDPPPPQGQHQVLNNGPEVCVTRSHSLFRHGEGVAAVARATPPQR